MRALKILALLILVAALGGGGFWAYRTYYKPKAALPPGIIGSNGRIEANETDLSAKFAGRLAEVLVQEGDMVTAGDVVARIDTADLEAALRAAEANVRQAEKAEAEANAQITLRKSELTLADQELDRAVALIAKGNVTQQRVDQNRNQRRTAAAALDAARSRVDASREAISAARAEADRLRVQVGDGVLKSPVSGRVLYRLAEPGEVLAGGGKVLTLLDLSSVYMTLFLPTTEAGILAMGAEGRIVLDALPNRAIPATVSFISARAQFTPRQVETKSERDRMMYRIKIRVPETLVQQYLEYVKTGLTGIGYVKLDPKAVWPDWLQSDLTKPAGS